MSPKFLISLYQISGESALISTDDMEGVIPNDVMFLKILLKKLARFKDYKIKIFLTDKIYAELSNEYSSKIYMQLIMYIQ